MGLRIGTNVASLAAARFANRAEKEISHSVRALSSGNRIVNIGDDAGGFAISEHLRSQSTGLKQARNNVDQATGLVQVAEGGLNEQNNILIRLRELAVQAASDTVSDEEREYLDIEFKQLVAETDRIAHTTLYGGKKLLTGTNEEFELFLGNGKSQHDIIKYKFDADTRADSLGIADLAIRDQEDAQSVIKDLDTGLVKLIKARAGYGAIQSRLDHAGNNLEVQYENIEAARSNIVDTDVAGEVAKLSQAQIKSQFAVAALSQANLTTERAVKLLG